MNNRKIHPNAIWLLNKTFKFVALVVVVAACLANGCLAASLKRGNIGCLYVNDLCIRGVEFCLDDGAIGRCAIPAEIDIDVSRKSYFDSASQHEFSDVMRNVNAIIERNSLPWDHDYIQCELENSMYAITNKMPYSAKVCLDHLPDHLRSVDAIEGDLSNNMEVDNDDDEATIHFSPPDQQFAEEVYYPPMKRLPAHVKLDFAGDEYSPFDYRTHYNAEKQYEPPAEVVRERQKNIKSRMEMHRLLGEYMSKALRPPTFYKDSIAEPNVQDLFLNEQSEAIEEFAPLIRPLQPSEKRKILADIEIDEYPSVFREHQQSKYILDGDQPGKVPSKNALHRRIETEPESESALGIVYTEGGALFPPNTVVTANQQKKMTEDLDSSNFLADMLGFSRHERLDVKKPGPKTPLPLEGHPALNASDKSNEMTKSNGIDIGLLPKIKKVMHLVGGDNDHGLHSVDTEYTHVILNTPMDTWDDGVRIINAIAELLNMKHPFTSIRVDRHEIAFRVEKTQNKTALEVARAINDSRFKNNLSRRYGVNVIRAGVGNKTKADVSNGEQIIASRLPEHFGRDSFTYILPFLLAGAAAAAVIIIIISIFLLRGYDQSKYKLADLQSSPSHPAEKDYQELCRARMTAKSNSNLAERVILANTQTERPPSSRSSTSSWCEEPTLTNMDISTGHMVLSYMEDHLRNKGRLQREWEVLCRYEAEPSAKDAALQEECTSLNRPDAPLPYDHSRVILNHLINAEGMDYINASTITDHDPRAPAYVAAQGPLPSTISHFWQMVWEQGAVVIVALCRLQENNESACARYWPEEGSEVYHIYEVHLVSEHTWCDDYLVRSFYLKNLRSGETRTVTQFHYLSWPQNGTTSAKTLLDFRRKVNKSYRGRSCPIVVHSGAGAGRTGAYILLDLVLGRMNKGAREIDIAATLEHLRDQRAGLVATRQQFEFVLMAVAEEVHSILKALPQNSQAEKRELDIETVKEHDDESGKKQTSPVEQPSKGENKK